MPKYTCKRCLKEFSQKSHFDKHLKRKRPCQNNKEKLELIVEEKVEKILENKFNISENKLNENKNEIINNKELNNMAEESKIEKNKAYTIAETFVGCGGAHFGFKKANFNSVFVNDIWDDAIKTLKMNDSDIEENKIICDTIYNLNDEYLKKLNIDCSDLDVLLGGVVCKGFSLAGVRNPYDKRNYLYLQQLRLVKLLKPKISIIENVPGMKNMKILSQNNSDNITVLCKKLTEICNKHKKCRGNLIAENKNLNKFKNKSKQEDKDNKNDHDDDHDDDNDNDIIKKEIKKIIEKITKIKKEKNELTKKRKELEKILDKYKYLVVEDIEKKYIEMGYKVYKKVLKCSEYGCSTNRRRLFIVAVRKDLNIEWTYPEPTTKDNKPTVKDAFENLDYDGINNPSVDKDNIPMNHRKSTIEKFKKVIYGVKNKDSYFSRGTSSRLSLDVPAPTLVPGHSSFQIHPSEHRSITVREGALITGFHNKFKFYGSHTSRCMQIGNAIPVNMAYHLALQCKKVLSQM